MINHLSQLREELSDYRTASCRLVHEKVLELTGALTTDIAELPVRRKGLCTAQARRKMLGCAHTPANHMFGQLADAVYLTGVLGDTAPPSSIITAIAVRIYELDVEKSTLEKKIALAKHNNDHPATESIQQKINDILSLHDKAISEMEACRKTIIDCLDKAICL